MSAYASNPFRVEIVSERPAWLSQFTSTLTWGEIPGTMMTSAGSGVGITAYSGACFNGLDMLVNGGGHNNYTGNEVIKLDLGSSVPSWSVVAQASPVETRSFNVKYYSDGKPASRHTYWSIQYVAQHNRLFLIGANATIFTDASGVPSPHVDGVNIATGQWDPGYGATWPDNPFVGNGIVPSAAALILDDGQGRFWMFGNGRVFRCDTATMAWTDCGVISGSTEYETAGLFDSKRNRLFRSYRPYGDQSPQYLSLNGYTSGIPPTTNVVMNGPHANKVGRFINMTYCGDLDRYLFIRSNDATNTVYQIHPETWYTDVLTVGGTAPVISYSFSGYYGRFAWVPGLNGCILAHDGDQNVKFFRTA